MSASKRWAGWLLAAAVGVGSIGPASAQEATPDTGDEAAAMAAWVTAMTPGPAHALMTELAGTWAVTTRLWMDPSEPPQVTRGQVVRTVILGGRVLHEDFRSEWEGQPFQGIGLRGYDNVTGRYWGTWTDNISTGVTVLFGQVNETGDVLVLEGQTPDPISGSVQPMRIEGRMDGPDREISEFYYTGPDGQLVRTMQIVYERL